MSNIDIVVLISFFIVSSYVSKKEFKAYELFVNSWKSIEIDTYVKYGSPEESNISFSSLKIKYGLIFNFDYKRILVDQELKKKAFSVQKYFFMQHILIVVFILIIKSWQ